MEKNLKEAVVKYVEDNIGGFHTSRLNKLGTMNLLTLIRKKNPYLYKAKHLVTAGDFIRDLATAFMSSAEESIFGNWLEEFAIFVAEKVYNGYKSAARGVDLEFDDAGIHYFVSIKSGPNWCNSSSLNELKRNFVNAQKIYNTSRKTIVKTRCVEGCCYGRNNRSYPDSTHIKICGKEFWFLISGEENFYVDIIEPLGVNAKVKNEEYSEAFVKILNKFTKEFTELYCDKDGNIDWAKIVKENSLESK